MFNNLKVSSRLFLLTVFASVVTIIVALFGLFGMARMSNNMDVMYNERTVAFAQLAKIDSDVGMLTADVFRSLQHNPASEINRIHANHAISEHLNAIEARLKSIEAAWKTFTSIPLGDEERVLVARFNEGYARFVNEVITPAIASLRANDFSYEVHEQFISGYRNLGIPVENITRELTELNARLAAENFKDANETRLSSRTNMVVAFTIGLLLSMSLAWMIIRAIVTPLSGLQKAMGEIEQSGDFTRRVDVSGSDEVGRTASSFNHLLGVMQKALGEILEHTTRIDAAATELATTAQQVAQSSEMTSETSSAMAASVEEMTVSVTQIGQSAQETFDITQQAEELSQQGANVINQTVSEMHAMSEAVRVSSESIAELSRHSAQISSIVQMIRDVADQTNLLALNAAIEAARAGDQGRGFAVVADEVRKLAERTASATGEIGAMITTIQGSAHSAVTAMNNAAGLVESGVALADQAGRAITDMQQGSKHVQTCVSDTSTILAEQSATSQTIAQQVERVAQAAEENSAAARSSSFAAENIEQLAHAMRGTVARFKV
ncbi:MAG: methyl-accepting chemotaxis protein [Azoarcus sp.]|nr:methyl-accepting chemotaxis protein [Azoarcus sp.]